MQRVLYVADYLVIAVMLFISTGIGLYFRFTGGRQKTTLEFFLGNKTMGYLPVAFSVMATIFSAVAVLGFPAENYLYGMQPLMMEFAYPIGVLFAMYMIVPVFFDMEISTIYQYLEMRFGKIMKNIISVLYSFQMILHMALVLYAPSLALTSVTDLSLWTCILSMCIVCTFYSALGGLKAVLWTDVYQALMMYFTTLTLIIKGTIDIGGISEVLKIAKEGQRLELLKYDCFMFA